MAREDINVKIISPLRADITTKKNKFSIYTSRKNTYVSTKTRIEMRALDDIENSRIVEVERYQVIKNGSVTLTLNSHFGFTFEKFIGIMIFIIEKYNL